MRITNKMLSDTFLADMQRNLNNLRKIQQQTSSTKNFSKPSDDPFNVVRAMQLQTDINANAQYKTNIVNSLNFMDTTDTALNQIGNVLSGIRQNLISGGDAAYGSDERSKIKDEINQRISQIAQLLNTNFQGDYIFGGTRGLTKPVMTDEYTIDSSVKVNFGSAEQWNGDITFNITNSSGKTTSETVTLSDFTAENTVDDVISKLNSDPNLAGKIAVSKTDDGNIKFVSEDSENTIKIEDTTIANDDIVSLKENLDGKKADFDPDEWQGKVEINFNVNGTDVPVTIDCDELTLSDPPTADEIAGALDNAVSGEDGLSNLNVENDGDKLKFTINGSDDIKITSASTLSLSALEGRKFSSEGSDNENISIKYLAADGSSLEYVPTVQTSDVDLDNWNGKSISFSGTTSDTPPDTYTGTITLDGTSENVDDLVKNINTKIQGNPDLKDKITAVKTDDGNIKFLAVNSGDDIRISDTTVEDDLDSLKDIKFSNVEMDNIASKRKAEVSQGVVVEYNACATEILQYGSKPDDNTAALLDRIVHHLAGQVASYTKADGTAYAEGDAGAVKDGEGNYYVWVDDEKAATKALTNEDLSDIDEASKQLLQVRSEIGAKANRMESMSDQNDDTKINMTEVLSKTEDIDITEKTIEYYTMITVYQASLQTSARVMQPTLMDYIS